MCLIQQVVTDSRVIDNTKAGFGFGEVGWIQIFKQRWSERCIPLLGLQQVEFCGRQFDIYVDKYKQNE